MVKSNSAIGLIDHILVKAAIQDYGKALAMFPDEEPAGYKRLALMLLEETLVFKLGLEGYTADEAAAKTLMENLTNEAVKALAKCVTSTRRAQESGATLKLLASRHQEIKAAEEEEKEKQRKQAVEEEEEKEKQRKKAADEEEKEKEKLLTQAGEEEKKPDEKAAEKPAEKSEGKPEEVAAEGQAFEIGQKVLIMGKLLKYKGCTGEISKILGVASKKARVTLLDGDAKGLSHDFSFDLLTLAEATAVTPEPPKKKA